MKVSQDVNNKEIKGKTLASPEEKDRFFFNRQKVTAEIDSQIDRLSQKTRPAWNHEGLTNKRI